VINLLRRALIEKPAHAWAGLIFMATGTVVFFFFKKASLKIGAA